MCPSAWENGKADSPGPRCQVPSNLETLEMESAKANMFITQGAVDSAKVEVTVAGWCRLLVPLEIREDSLGKEHKKVVTTLNDRTKLYMAWAVEHFTSPAHLLPKYLPHPWPSPAKPSRITRP